MLTLLTLLGGGVKDWFLNKQKIAAAETENKVRLLSDKETNNHEWEMASLTDKDKWMRRVSFGMFTFPLFWIYFDPDASKAYFQILDTALPAWYKQTYMGMTGGIWGISTLKNTVPGLVSGVVKAIRK